mgnify:FL=1
MGHYEVLGVDPEASMAQIRSAYLDLARRTHPDRHAGDEGARLVAEERMRLVNEAWAVLGDVDARSAYDRERLAGASAGAARPTGPRGSTDEADPRAWKPFHHGDVPTFDERDDRPITAGGLPNWLRLAPPMSFVGGLVAIVAGGFVGILPAVALGMTLVLVSAALFLVAPLVAMASSRRGERSP